VVQEFMSSSFEEEKEKKRKRKWAQKKEGLPADSVLTSYIASSGRGGPDMRKEKEKEKKKEEKGGSKGTGEATSVLDG